MDLFGGERRVVVDDLFRGEPLGEGIQDDGNVDAGAAYAGLPAASVGIDRHATSPEPRAEVAFGGPRREPSPEADALEGIVKGKVMRVLLGAGQLRLSP